MEKAAYGTACNHCGLCCLDQLCPLAQLIFRNRGSREPCPALETTADGVSSCGVVAHPEIYAPRHPAEDVREVAALAIGAGIGCDARAPEEPDAPSSYRWALKKAADKARRVSARVTAIWGWL